MARRELGKSCPRLQVPQGFGPKLNVLHRWVETDFQANLLLGRCLRDRFEPRVCVSASHGRA
jgi:hypothetical protein